MIGARTLTLGLVMAGWVLFRAPDLPAALGYYSALVSPDMMPLPFEVARAAGNRAMAILTLASLVFVLPRAFRMPDLMEQGGPKGMASRIAVLAIGYPYALTLVIAGAFTAFIYFQF